MTINQIECFIQVAEQLSFVGAAKRLYTTQPAITYQIRSMEKELGTQLFYRTNRTVSLTETGRTLYQAAKQIYELYFDTLSQIEDIEKRNRSFVVIGVRKLFDYSILSGSVKQYNELHPTVKVDVIPQSEYEPLEYLYTHKTNISFLFDIECEDNDDIAFFPIYKMEYFVLMNENHPLANRKKLSLQDLKGCKIILPDDDYRRRIHVPSIEDLQEVGADLSLTSPSFEGSMILTQAEMGITFITSNPEKRFPHMALVPFDTPPVQIGMAWLKNDVSPETHAFMDLVRKKYKN
ncbi:MAG: LysR family transcriptional regulator [Lachnospiraceae bacterium]|nr:LysR family transcriptional regulator [Lachnospiraceae bacterium]